MNQRLRKSPKVEEEGGLTRFHENNIKYGQRELVYKMEI